MDRLYPSVKAQRDGFQHPSSPYAFQSVPLNLIEAVGGFAGRYEKLALDLLEKNRREPDRRFPGPGSDGDPATSEIMRQWLEAHPSPQDLFAAFNVITPSVKANLIIPDKTLNGPCCLTEELIDKQWKTTQPTGVAFTAILLASWFERQFAGERARPGRLAQQGRRRLPDPARGFAHCRPGPGRPGLQGRQDRHRRAGQPHAGPHGDGHGDRGGGR